jgi:LmbE family N-acetylglucosaminyl deacetylase
MGCCVLISLAASLTGAQEPAVPVRSALEPARAGGIEVVERALAKLSTHRRVLMIGAHPDDEDTSMLTLVARGMGGEAAYLALSRGDGGQNLIGTELGVGLGVIRTQELLAARRIDGARQFFTRAFDFGYTRSLEETFERWPREELLTDVARVVWRFRPQVIVSVFPNDGRGGHGQHQAAGWAAHAIFDAAGESGRFDSLIGEGWLPWQPSSLFRRTFFDPENATFEVSLGATDGLSGRSMLQIAMQSRSQHRSQDMGTLQPLGTRRAGLVRTGGIEAGEKDELFAGIDTRLSAIAAVLPAGDLRRAVETRLAQVESIARETRRELSPVGLPEAAPALAQIVGELSLAAEAAARAEDVAAGRIASEMILEKRAVAEAGLAAASGVALEATLSRESVAPGESATLAMSVWNSGPVDIEIESVEILAADGWSTGVLESGPGVLAPGELGEWTREARVAGDAQPSMGYYLRSPRQGDLYDWQGTSEAWWGLPYQPPELAARFELSIGGQSVRLEREVAYRYRDQAQGEVRRPIRIAPRVEVRIEPSLMLWDPADRESREVRLTAQSQLQEAVSGTVRPRLPAGWNAPPVEFEIAEPGGETTVAVKITPPDVLERGDYTLGFAVELAGGALEAGAVPLLEYPHIRPTPLPVRADLRVSAFPLQLPDVGPVGYVRGASDRVPESLKQVGLEVELLDADQLARGDLSRFRVIVIGSRAFEIDPALVAANSRLLEFARAGGVVIVQYQQYQYVRGGFAPYPLEINRPHDRITDEQAPVRQIEAAHPVFHSPNALGEQDWQGWVQERGLYFAGTWDKAWKPLLAMKDPEREEQSGGLLVAPVGEGLYVYTGLAFFRQLPAGVAGGYRLLANLLALGEDQAR